MAVSSGSRFNDLTTCRTHHEKGAVHCCTAPTIVPRVVSVTALLIVAHVRQGALDGSSRRHRRAHQMRAAAGALPALEVAVRGRRAALAGLEPVGVHGETHRAALDAP